jgi:F-box protein 21
MIMLGDPNPTTELHRRRQLLPYLVEHFQAHFPEDINLLEKYIPPMFVGEREHEILMHVITRSRTADRNAKAPNRRGPDASKVHYKIGNHFRHRRYGYEGVIVGWDMRCGAEQHWIERMRVDDLPRGRDQPFYNVVYDESQAARLQPASSHRHYYTVLCVYDANVPSRADDKSVRYVAEENIEVLGGDAQCSDALMQLAGRYFKRWDSETSRFVSNMKDEYPDD